MNKKKKSLRILSIFLFIFVVALGAALYFLYTAKQDIKERDNEIAELNAVIAANQKVVYVATDDMTAGTKLELGVNVTDQQCVTGLPDYLYMQYEDLGKILITDVDAYQPIMANMLTDEIFENDTREVEIAMANLMLDQQVNDYVDIRIMFPDASEFIVASKLKIKKMSLENNIMYCNMSEDEILTLASATIDAFTITGTKIYITRYVEPNLQDEAIPNYPVKQETLLLMASDPNILHRAEQTLNAKARAELESRLAMLSEDQLIAINAGHGLIDTAHANAYVTQTQNTVTVFEDENPEELTEE